MQLVEHGRLEGVMLEILGVYGDHRRNFSKLLDLPHLHAECIGIVSGHDLKGGLQHLSGGEIP